MVRFRLSNYSNDKLEVFLHSSICTLREITFMPTLESFKITLTTATVFMLATATMMCGGQACCVRSGLNGVHDGLRVLRALVFESVGLKVIVSKPVIAILFYS